ncbi:SAP domain-containing protein [uncultured Parasutterella sp.]|uniref:SAP domain-containing protein n=1 Tax=uncultured Parasutterella sp. TaxID=1263098 RepID=UPI0025A5DB22|nr:SAP domain-containing protein [uncultured Parasutterella sp.]
MLNFIRALFKSGNPALRKDEPKEELLDLEPEIATSIDPTVGAYIDDLPIKVKDADQVVFEEKMSTAYPSKNGLYPNQLKLLDSAKYFETEQQDYPIFWSQEYGFKDVSLALKQLEKDGFIQAGDLKAELSKKLKLPDIKKMLKDNDQKVTGKKEELLDRLLGLSIKSELEQKYTSRPYYLTEKGKQELDNNAYIRCRYFSVWDMNKWTNENPEKNWIDIVKIKLAETDRVYELYELYLQEKDYLPSFRSLLRLIFSRIDSSTQTIISSIKLFGLEHEVTQREIEYNFEYVNTLTPRLFFFQDVFSLTEDQFKELIKRELKFQQRSYKVPVSLYVTMLFDSENRERLYREYITKAKK